MKIRCVIIAALCAMMAASCAKPEYRRAEGAAWGTVYHIVYKSDKDLSDSVVAEMRKVELSLSMFDSNSTVARINSRASNVADPYIKAVMAVAAKVNNASHGSFDPTVAPLVDLWGFGRKGRDTAIPDSATIAEVLGRVGYDRISLRGDTITMPEGMELDFSAIAKGFGVDCVAAMLRRNGCRDYMVEIGGEVSVSGVNTYGEQWRIMVQPPCDSLSNTEADVLQLTDCAVATSGNYRNNRPVATDSVVGHTIDPRTGYPKHTMALSATVIAPMCVLADALATTLMATDPDSAQYIIRQFPSTRAVLYTATPSGEVETLLIP